MSLRTKFILTTGLGVIFFLFIITSLVFNSMGSKIEYQLEQRFHSDARARVDSFNNKLSGLTDKFISTSNLPIFRSMNFNKLTLNHAGLKNDIREMELYILGMIHKNQDITQVKYINNKGSEIFRVDTSGIKTNLSDLSQDITVQKMLNTPSEKASITLEHKNSQITNIVWWTPVYVSADKLDGIMVYSIDYNFILKSLKKITSTEAEHVCIRNMKGESIVSTGHGICDHDNNSLWHFNDAVNIPGKNWRISVSVDPDFFLREINNTRMIVFGIIFPLVSLFAFISLLIFSNYIISAIRKLVDGAKLMGTTQEFRPIKLDRNDELGELAIEMNRSAALIEKHRNELKKSSQDALEKSRRNLQAIMDHSPAVIYVKDINLRYTFINHTFEELFHIHRDEVVGKTDFDLFPEKYAEKFQDNDKQVVLSGKAMETEESAPHGTDMHTYISMKFPLLDESDSIYAICGISTDITLLKRQEEKIRRSQKMDALGKLTGGIAHDYNNMLGVILGYTELLSSEVSKQPNLLNYTNQIKHAGERGAKLTQKLLAFSRKTIIDAERLNINALLLNSKHMLEKTLTARIRLIFDLQEELWDAYLDSDDLEDAIINISINAMHAIKENGQITYQTRNESINSKDAITLDLEPGEYVTLNITDTGKGIEHENLDKIFDPFYSTKGDRGTGLGLSQVYGFIENNKGKIKVYSEPDKGTSIILYFPRNQITLQNKKIKTSKPSTQASANETIMIVDDEPALVELTAEILIQQGYNTICAHSAKEALDMLKSNSVDLLLSDVIMPDMDGYQLAKTVQKEYPHIKIQLASGFNDDRHVTMVDNTLNENLLHKPYKQQVLLDKLRELLDNTKSENSSN